MNDCKESRTMTSEEIRKTILSKIDYILGGICGISSRDADLKSAQAVRELSEAYKILEEKK